MKALKGDEVHDDQLMNLSLMKEMHWTWQELMDTPLHVILAKSFLDGRIKVFENLQEKKKGGKK